MQQFLVTNKTHPTAKAGFTHRQLPKLSVTRANKKYKHFKMPFLRVTFERDSIVALTFTLAQCQLQCTER
jgi:hypothetical protein